jgi:hypothetical protein
MLVTDLKVSSALHRARMRTDIKSLISAAVSERQRLQREIEQMKEERLCVVCMERNKNVTLLPCAHLCMCMTCSDKLQSAAAKPTCPLCQTTIERHLQTFL